jgi:RNA polymerase sigma factor (sigma-70 family)
MPADRTCASSEIRPEPVFATTRWSEVLAAGQGNSSQGEEALARLCESYWYPIYAFVRRRGLSPEDAQDSTQEFFSRLLSGNWLSDADRAKGRFRTFLLTALNRFLANEWDRARAQKRGGGVLPVPFDTKVAETRYCGDTKHEVAPDHLYDRQWAVTLLDRALGQLEAEQRQMGKSSEFTVLSSTLTAERGDIPYAALAAQMGLSENAARMAVHRLRKRFRQVFREEIAQTVAEPGEVEAEIRHLVAALAG